MKTRPLLSSLVPVLSFALSGCGLGQFGGEVNNNDGLAGEGQSCEDVASTALATGETAPDGSLKLDDLVELVSGEFQAEMAWGTGEDSGALGDIKLIPGRGDTSISIKIEVIESSGTFVERDRANRDGRENNNLADIEDEACANRLTVDARVTVHTENGALDDEFTTTFWTEDGVIANADIPLKPGELQGSFDVDVSAIENAKLYQTTLNLQIAFGNMSGEIRGSVEIRSKDAVSLGAGFVYGNFPKDNPCERGVSLPADADLRSEAQALFDEHTAFDFKWTGESETVPMSITTELKAICYVQASASYGESAGYAATVASKVVSEEANIDGSWALDAQVTVNDEGKLSRVDVVRNSYMVLGVEPEQFAEESGISGITSDADQLSFTFGYHIDAGDDATASGELTVLALSLPECLTSPPVEERESDGSMTQGGSPGCEGISADEIKNAQLTLASE